MGSKSATLAISVAACTSGEILSADLEGGAEASQT